MRQVRPEIEGEGGGLTLPKRLQRGFPDHRGLAGPHKSFGDNNVERLYFRAEWFVDTTPDT